MIRKTIQPCVTLFVALLITLAPIFAQKPDKAKKAQKEEKTSEKGANSPEVIWRDPGDVSTLNLFYGAGGKDHAPDPNGKYTFVKEELDGTSPKFDVDDEQGMRWRVKLGAEPQAETAATRLLWAAGYYVTEDYYLAELKVEGLPKLRRGQKFVSADGTVHRVRLKRRPKDEKKLGDWDWFDNPFVGQRELNGLKIMMSLVNNWDLKAINNSILEKNGEREYLVTDVGASFGKTGNSISRSKGDPKGYAETRFVEKETPDHIDFVMHSRPFFVTAVDVPNYQERTRMERVTKDIPRSDAKWLGQILSKLSESQIRDCFRAGGYTPEEVDECTATVMKRIAELNSF